MECCVPYQRFEPNKCQLGPRQQNKRYPTAEYIAVSYKDSMIDMPALQMSTPWLFRPVDIKICQDVLEFGWSLLGPNQGHGSGENILFQKLRVLHEHMRQSLVNHHRIKLNQNQYILSVYVDKLRTPTWSSEDGALIDIEKTLKNSLQQYKLCIRLAGIHLQHGVANYRFKCVSILVR
jgi:hypothetical protein